MDLIDKVIQHELQLQSKLTKLKIEENQLDEQILQLQGQITTTPEDIINYDDLQNDFLFDIHIKFIFNFINMI